MLQKGLVAQSVMPIPRLMRTHGQEVLFWCYIGAMRKIIQNQQECVKCIILNGSEIVLYRLLAQKMLTTLLHIFDEEQKDFM